MRRLRARLVIGITQNAIALVFVAVWMAANAVLFARDHTPLETLELLIGLTRAETTWGRIYQPFTQVVVFGVVVSMIVSNVTRRHRPEATARLLAGEARDHVVIVGYTHLGERIHDAMVERGDEVVVIEQDREKVSALLHDEAPLVLGDARDEEVLQAAAIDRARVVAVTADEVEVAAVVARHVRARNPTCELILRCPNDDIGEVLSRAHRARIVSTSKLVADHIRAASLKRGDRRVAVLGENNIGNRVAKSLAERGVHVTQLPLTDDPQIESNVDLVVIADDDLGKNLIRVDRIRRRAPQTRIVCRAFHEQAAEILTKPPFKCEILSSSRLALDALLASGAFGVERRALKPRLVSATNQG
jgi:Trk K+ transport system NAD-binding subunit